ncbi:hypothetical protein ABTQ05_20135, partial [Acinetobacter baumannii]
SPDYGTRCSTVLRVPIVGEPVLTEHVVDPMAMHYSAEPATDKACKIPCKPRVQEASPEEGLQGENTGPA